MLESHPSTFPFPVTHVEAWSTQNHIEIHSIDSNTGIILDTQIYVFLDTKTKVASRREVVLVQLVFFYLQEQNYH